MSRFRRGFVLVLAMLFVGAAGSLSASTGVAAVDAKWEKAFAANDVNAVMKCYAPDAVAWLPESPEAKGTAAIRANYEGFFAANTINTVTMLESHVKTVGARSVGWGRFSLTMTPKAGGASVTMTGRYTEVAELRNGKWVYIVDHASADPAPAAAEAAKH